MPNRLARESSPYLLQHRDNPVDWYPWGAEALGRAKAEDKPIFLSIGYSACHWCHVMEHESFENPEIAKLINDDFVAIKVDREERPDLDQVYMHAVQLMTGRGGWPMSVFLTPDLRPFYGGTYWPPRDRHGMPGFERVVRAVADAWQNRRSQTLDQADELTAHLRDFNHHPDSGQGLREELLVAASSGLERLFDFQHGGFGGAPKFPHPMDLQLLLRCWHRWPRAGLLEMVDLTLDRMAHGGIYDHLAGGFARYSVDARWLVPHFEKMLYDNALLATAYLEAHQATGNAAYARVARETLDYVLAYMADPRGGFHSTEDADSEGEEGKFYVWNPDQIHAVLGPERGARFCYVYDVTAGGNFEHGQSILNLPKTIAQCAALKGWNAELLAAELADSRARLLAVRDGRVRPSKDDKVLVSWNALLIDALARASRVLDGGSRFLSAAERAADFIRDHLRRPDGRLLHSWRGGAANIPAYLDDYAYLINALVSLYEASFDERRIDDAVSLADTMLRHFSDLDDGGFFFTADDQETLVTRPKDQFDSSVPSGNAMAATALVKLGRLCGRDDYLAAAHGTLAMAVGVMEKSAMASGQLLLATDLWLGPTHETVVIGARQDPATAEVLDALRRRFLPRTWIASRDGVDTASYHSPHLDGLFAGKPLHGVSPTLYVCQHFACQAPAVGRDAAIKAIDQLSPQSGPAGPDG